MILKFSESDLLQSIVLPPAWYRVTIDEVDDKPTKEGDSTNTWLKGKVLFNSDTGAKEFEAGLDKDGNPIVKKIEGVPTPFPWIFNSKIPSFAVGFAEALGLKVTPDVEFNLQACKGRQVDMFIENVVYNGVVKNSVSGKYRAPRNQ